MKRSNKNNEWVEGPVFRSLVRSMKREMMRKYDFNKGMGFVYLMCSENGYYKIGRAKDVKRRLDGLVRQFPIRIEVEHRIACLDYCQVEGFLHEKFAEKRVQHEWFKLDPQDVDWIKSQKDYDLDTKEVKREAARRGISYE